MYVSGNSAASPVNNFPECRGSSGFIGEYEATVGQGKAPKAPAEIHKSPEIYAEVGETCSRGISLHIIVFMYIDTGPAQLNSVAQAVVGVVEVMADVRGINCFDISFNIPCTTDSGEAFEARRGRDVSDREIGRSGGTPSHFQTRRCHHAGIFPA